MSLCVITAHADIIFTGGNIRTDNSSSTNIIFDGNGDGTADSILDAGGNLGLGTLTPSANVDVAGDVFVSGELVVGGTVLNTDGSLQDGLVGWWSFDGLDSSGNVIDHSGQGNDGTPTNGPIHKDGKFGKAYEFDGSNDYVQVSDFNNLPDKKITVACWVNLNSHKDWNRLVNHEWVSSGWLLYAGVTHDIAFGIGQSNTQYVAIGTDTLNLNTWHHVVGTYDGSQVRLYVNSVLSANTIIVNATLDTDGNISIADLSGGAEGALDDIRIYNRALSQKEITTLYTHGQAKLATGGTISDNLIVTGNLSITEHLHFNSISQPSSPNVGQVYSNGSNLQFYNGTEWLNLTAGGNTAWTQPGSGNLLYANGSVTMGSIANKQGTLMVGNGGSSDNILTLDDNGASVFTVADGGSLGIGTTNPSKKLDVVGTAGFGETSIGGNITLSDNLMPSANVSYDIGTAATSLNAAYATDYVLLSDQRLKNLLGPVQNSTASIAALNPVQYHFKQQVNETRLGLIAQEVEKIVPDMVHTGQDINKTKALSYQEITVLLLASEKDQKIEMETLFDLAEQRMDAIQKERERLLKKIAEKKRSGGRE